MADVVDIDELRIVIDADSQQAANGLERLIGTLDRLKTATNGVTSGNGLTKLKRQITELKNVSQSIQGLSGFDRLTQMVNALRGLNSLSTIDTAGINRVTNALTRLPAAIQAINSMPNARMGSINSLTRAFSRLSRLNGANINSATQALARLPQVATAISGMDVTPFVNQMQRLAVAIQPLAQQLETVATAARILPRSFFSATSAVQQNTNATNANNTANGTLRGTLGSLRTSVVALAASFLKLKQYIADCFTASNQFVENLNLFRVTMGESAEQAYDFAEAVNEALGIDVSAWIRYQGFFQSIGKGFGVVEKKATLMSQNLTQLAYDISSFYNISAEDAYLKVQAGFAGELEPLRRYGFALDEATLKQLAFEKGITQSLETMTQAQKAQLRYTAMIEQAQAIGVTGDMARTVDTAANGVRILSAQMKQLARAVGNALVPAMSLILPYLTAVIQVATEGMQKLAELLGFELPDIKIGTAITSGYADITESASEATSAVEKFKGSLAGVDQLNIIGSKKDSGTGDGFNMYDLDIELPEYDFLQGVESKISEIADKIKQTLANTADVIERFMPIIEPFGGMLLGVVGALAWSGVGKVGSFFTGIGLALSKIKLPVLTGFVSAIGSFLFLKNGFKGLVSGEGSFLEIFGQLNAGIALATTAIVGFLAFGNPVGATIVAISAVAGVLAGEFIAVNDAIAESNKVISDNVLFRSGGTKISAIADAYTEWAGAATQANNATIAKYAELDKYESKMGELVTTMQEIAGTDLNLDEITPADAEALKEPFNSLVEYLQSEFKERVEMAAESLKSAFSNLGIAETLSGEMALILGEFEKTKDAMQGRMSQTQTTVSEYLDIISAGGTLSQEQMTDLSNKVSYINDMAKLDDEKYLAWDEAKLTIDTIDWNNINLESDQTAKAAMEQLNTATEDYVKSIEERYKAEMDNLDKLKRKLQVTFDNEQMSKEEYAHSMDVIETVRSILGMNAAEETRLATNYADSFYTGVLGKIDTAANQQLATPFQDWTGFWHGVSGQAVAKADYLKDSELYQMASGYQSSLAKLRPYYDTSISEENAFAEMLGYLEGVASGSIQIAPEVVYNATATSGGTQAYGYAGRDAYSAKPYDINVNVGVDVKADEGLTANAEVSSDNDNNFRSNGRSS